MGKWSRLKDKQNLFFCHFSSPYETSMKSLIALLFISNALQARIVTLPKRPDGTVYVVNSTLQPGDTVQLVGDYLWIQVRPIMGTKEKPIVFTNKGDVNIGGFKSYTMILAGQHYKVIGNKSGKFVIGKPGVYSMGLNLGLSTNVEVANIEFQYLQTGIQQNPPGKLLMEDCYYHHNYFHDLDNPAAQGRSEAFYLGSTASTGGAYFKNCRIENNRIDKVSGDGIQVSLGTFLIRNNKISNYGLANLRYQNNGILVGGHATADVLNNEVSNGKGIALQILGRGLMNVIGNKFTNIDTRLHADDIIYINGKTATADNKLQINFRDNTFSGLQPGRKVIMNGTTPAINGGIRYGKNAGLKRGDILMVARDVVP